MSTAKLEVERFYSLYSKVLWLQTTLFDGIWEWKNAVFSTVSKNNLVKALKYLSSYMVYSIKRQL